VWFSGDRAAQVFQDKRPALAVVATATFLLNLGLAAASHGGTCTLEHVAVDTLGNDGFEIRFDGRGAGQVVLCPDTVVTSVTFWLMPPPIDAGYSCTLYISKGPASPDSFFLDVPPIYIGPTLNGFYPGGSPPVPVTFTLNPPCLLPSPGLYFFIISEASCLGEFKVMSHTEDVYPQGRAWRTGASLCDGMAPGTVEIPSYPVEDLVFDVAFCKDTTPVHASSWGAIKTRYR